MNSTATTLASPATFELDDAVYHLDAGAGTIIDIQSFHGTDMFVVQGVRNRGYAPVHTPTTKMVHIAELTTFYEVTLALETILQPSKRQDDTISFRASDKLEEKIRNTLCLLELAEIIRDLNQKPISIKHRHSSHQTMPSKLLIDALSRFLDILLAVEAIATHHKAHALVTELNEYLSTNESKWGRFVVPIHLRS